jgi:hypothetical protein
MEENKSMSTDSPSEEAPLTKPRKSGKGGTEMPKEEEIKVAGEKPDQNKAGDAVKEQPKEKVDSKVRSGVQRLRRNSWR